MSHPVVIEDGAGQSYSAKVTQYKQLVVAPLEYDDTVFKELAEDDTAYSFYPAKPAKRFVITGIVAKADKQVSSTVDATVVVYEAASDTTTSVSKVLFQMAMVEGDLVTITPINILVTEGFWVNAKTTDDDIHMTIMGYYVTL